ncbi:MAG: efflux RND transporter periplasmic adaptor subunit [Deltaproteobacteria bacterium]|nr:efflux RND transporter periplasmic adaptor subunit [Deltaproteobacteria bacterium]
MKIKYLLIGLLAMTIAGGIFVACSKGGGSKALHDEQGEISHYTCPMHPQIHEDHPGECPICHMTLVPVYKEKIKPAPTTSRVPTETGPSAMISAERQQLIGIKTVEAVRKPLTREIRTTGRVAYDPELAVAQREFVEVVKNVPSLKPSAMARLKLLGMSDTEIAELAKKKTVSSNLYLPTANQPLWIYATLYESETGIVQPGMSAEITLPSGGIETWQGTIRAVDPVVDAATRSFRARIEIDPVGAHGRAPLRPDTYVNVSIAIDLGEKIAIPQSAVIDSGTRKIAFVVHDGEHFQSREIKTGSEAGDEIVVLDGIEEGETVVVSSTFMVDSESQLKAAVSSSSTPSCPEGQKWDTSMNMCM